MTKVLVIGASGRIASLAAAMLKNDSSIELSLFVRNPQKLPTDLQDQKIFKGDATQPSDLTKAIQEQYVVFAGLAGDVVTEAQEIVKVMDQVNVKRLIWIAASGIYNEIPGKFGELNTRALPGYLQTYREAADIIANSDLDYTIIRPAWLTDLDEVDYELTHHNETFKGTEVSRKSVAAYAVSLIKDPTKDIKDSVGVDKPGTDGDRPRKAVMEANGFDPNM